LKFKSHSSTEEQSQYISSLISYVNYLDKLCGSTERSRRHNNSSSRLLCWHTHFRILRWSLDTHRHLQYYTVLLMTSRISYWRGWESATATVVVAKANTSVCIISLSASLLDISRTLIINYRWARWPAAIGLVPLWQPAKYV